MGLEGNVGSQSDITGFSSVHTTMTHHVDFTWRFFRCEGVVNYGILSAFIFHYFSLTFEV